jgi:hypothetical protein
MSLSADRGRELDPWVTVENVRSPREIIGVETLGFLRCKANGLADGLTLVKKETVKVLCEDPGCSIADLPATS